MEHSEAAPDRVRFGAFELDLRAGELHRNGTTLRLQEQPLLILRVLLEKPGQVVTREELRQRIWPADTFVDFDHGLYTAITKLREALRDSSGHPRYIETLPRRGYRFIASLESVSAEPARPSETKETSPRKTKPDSRRIWRWVATLALALLITAVAGFLVTNRLLGGRTRSSRAGAIRSLAVLPLQNLSGDPQQEYFADGMTEELITELSKISALRVISRTSSMAYKGTRKTLPEVARELNVDAFVEGSVAKAGDEVRISAQLIDVSSDRNVWAETYVSDMKDVLGLQSKVAEAVAKKIQISVTPQERGRLASASPVNPAAHDAYLLGRFHLSRDTEPELRKAIDYFEEATQTQPDFSEAYVGLASSYMSLTPEYLAPRDTLPTARVAVMKALKLDSDLADAHAALATIYINYDWQWDAARREIERAIELDANSVMARENLAFLDAILGQEEDATRELKRAQELDPLSTGANYLSDRAWTLYTAHRYEVATEQCHKDSEIIPGWGWPHSVLGLIALERGQSEQALAEARKGVELDTRSNFNLEILGGIEAELGMRKEALSVIETLRKRARTEYVCQYELGVIYAALGDKNSAFRYLNRAYDDRDVCMANLDTDPRLTRLRSDARFRDLARRVGFPSSM